MAWLALHPDFTVEHLGFLPDIISAEDPRPVREQVEANYGYGGGWSPQPGWEVNPQTLMAQYPGDPPFRALAMTIINGEIVLFFPSSYVCVVQPDNSYEMARMD